MNQRNVWKISRLALKSLGRVKWIQVAGTLLFALLLDVTQYYRRVFINPESEAMVLKATRDLPARAIIKPFDIIVLSEDAPKLSLKDRVMPCEVSFSNPGGGYWARRSIRAGDIMTHKKIMKIKGVTMDREKKNCLR